MRSCHAAALALIGWYLLMPPMSTATSPASPAPLSLWDQVSKANSLEACQIARMLRAEDALNRFDQADWLFDYTEHERKEALLGLTPPDAYLAYRNARVYALAVALSRCIATDDPRLKQQSK